MTSTIERLLKGSYDADLCCHLYWHGDDYHLLLECMLPLIRIVLLREMYDFASDEDFILDGLQVLSENLFHHKYDSDFEDADHFNGFFYQALKRQFIRRYWDSQYFMPFDHSESWRPQYDIIHPLDVEYHIYLEQLPGYVSQLVLDRIRFTDQELNACLYVLNQLLKGGRIIAFYMKQELKVKDPQFYVNYILVLLRQVLYELKLQGSNFLNHVQRYATELGDEDS